MDTFVPSARNFARLVSRRGRRGQRAAFSLIEIALALGVLSFGFLATFGLIPVGMGTFRQAMDTSIGSEIVQRVLNDARQTDFNDLVLASGSNGKSFRYFDNQGIEVTGTNTAVAPANAIYQVNTRINPTTMLPITSGSNSLTTLATVTVQITNNPGHQTIAMDPTNLWNDPKFFISTYSGMVAQSTNQ
jgi:uncharacterized protein (TIGR02598 family)